MYINILYSIDSLQTNYHTPSLIHLLLLSSIMVFLLEQLCNNFQIQPTEYQANAYPLTHHQDVPEFIHTQQNGKELSSGCNCRTSQWTKVMYR